MGNRRGIALILVMWIMLALILVASGIAMMARTETQISRNTSDVNRCRWAARAGIYATIQQLQTNIMQGPTYLTEDPYTISSTDLNMDLDGYTFSTVVEDEAGKVNLNAASLTTIADLFDDDDVADYILAWRSPAATASTQSTGTDYYSTLNPPYKCKNAPFETVDEIRLVEGVTSEMLSAPPPALTGASRPVNDLLTVYAPNTPRKASTGTQVDIQTATQAALQSALGSVLTSQDVTAIVQYRSRSAFRSPAEIVRVTSISRSKIEQIYDQLTVTGATAHTGLVNINTAPLEVLAVQPGLDAATAQAILDYRGINGAFNGVGYLLAVNDVSSEDFVSAAPYLTAVSNVFKIKSTGQLASTKASATITCVVEIDSSGQAQTRYWQE